MRLHEYQTKQLFSRYGIPIPKGKIVSNVRSVKKIVDELGGEVVVKAQIHSGGRGKAGGIKLAKSTKEAQNSASSILGKQINNFHVRQLLIDEFIQIQKELYLGITLDRSKCKPVIIASEFGGIDIEEVSVSNPEKIIAIEIDPLLGLQDHQIRTLAIFIEIPVNLWNLFSLLSKGLWELFIQLDALLVEINPLAITKDQSLMAIDGKMEVDENALFRHPEVTAMQDLEMEKPLEVEARNNNLTYIKMDGNIGCLVNGAGLAMATMDVLELYGGQPANFLDIGGGASSDKVSSALRILLKDNDVRTMLINIFGGITRCDEVAKGMIVAFEEIKPCLPIVVRFVGTNAKEGIQLLKKHHYETAETLVDAAQRAVNLTQESINEHSRR